MGVVIYLRGTRVSEFAFGALPGWPFATYVLLTIAGIALLALGLPLGDFRIWVGSVALAADVLFPAGYLRFRDIPPFVTHLLPMWSDWPFSEVSQGRARTRSTPAAQHAGVEAG